MKKTYKSKWLVISSDKIIENGFFEVENGQIINYGSAFKKHLNKPLDFGETTIIPKLINAHTHLELCALKNNVTKDKGFIFWIKDLIKKRAKFTINELKAFAKNELLKLDSICGLCEISSLNITKDILINSQKEVKYFVEILGTNAALEFETDVNSLIFSLAAHAPHTCSSSLLRQIKKATKKNKTLFSIHTAESKEEVEFISEKKGSWAEFLKEKNINFASWELLKKSPVEYLDILNILDDKTLLVHLVEATKKDFEIIREKKANICLCPRSNYELHKNLPDIDTILKIGLLPSLGTDSLASTASLDVFDEMAFISSKYKNIHPKTIFEMATINGANALGLKNLGSLEKNKKAEFLNVDINGKDKAEILERISAGGFQYEAFE